jgi:hypothetical protein
MKKWELIVKWDTGECTTDLFDSEDAAERAVLNLKKAFGHQVTWTGIIEKWV